MFEAPKQSFLRSANVKGNKILLHHELSKCEYILTYTFEELKKEIHLNILKKLTSSVAIF